MLHREVLLPEASDLFDVLKSSPELKGATLIGGTALALQLGHRVSLDFDFAYFQEHIPTLQIEQLVSRLKKEKHQVQLITSPDMISQFRINEGVNLLDFVRDYVINGVKVTFFAHGKNLQQKDFYIAANKTQVKHASFNLMGIEGLKVAKTLVLADRVRSRDLYDLYILIKHHQYSISDVFSVIKEVGVVDDPEYYKAIMRGEAPLDIDDEGLSPVDIDISIVDIYAYLNERLNQYETDVATQFFSSS